jgi:small-conductance mechanosensitive channel
VEGVLERPTTEVWVEEFGESSVNLAVRFWHAPDVATLWRVRSHVAVAVKNTLDELGVEIPYPQRTRRFAVDAGSDAESEPASAASPTGASVNGAQSSQSE